MELIFEDLEKKWYPRISSVPRLSHTEDFSRATDLQVFERELKPSTEIGVLLESDESFFGVTRELRISIGQEGVCLSILAADSSPELMKGRESKVVCLVDDDRVGIGKVDSIFDHGRREEDIASMISKSQNLIFELFFVHPTVDPGDLEGFAVYIVDVVCDLFDLVCESMEALDSVVEDDDLSSPLDLSLDRVVYDSWLVSHDMCLYGLALSRWSREERDLFDSRESHIERSWDRCRGE